MIIIMKLFSKPKPRNTLTLTNDIVYVNQIIYSCLLRPFTDQKVIKTIIYLPIIYDSINDKIIADYKLDGTEHTDK